MSRKLYALLSLVLIASFALAACGTPAATEAPVATEKPAEPAAPAATEAPKATEAPAAEKVTVTWWHISTAEEHKAVWQKLADEYMAAHPNVTIEITVLENEAFKTKLTTVMQSGEPPDIFQSWGGGVRMNMPRLACSKTSPLISMPMAAPGATPLPPVLWVSMPTKARIMACRGIWA